MLWGKNRESEKGQQPPGDEPSTLLTWAASALPLSHIQIHLFPAWGKMLLANCNGYFHNVNLTVSICLWKKSRAQFPAEELFTIETCQLSLIHRHDNRHCTLVTVDILARKPNAIIVLVTVRKRQHTETMESTQCLTGVVCNDPWHHWILHYVIETAVREAAGEFPASTTLILLYKEGGKSKYGRVW